MVMSNIKPKRYFAALKAITPKNRTVKLQARPKKVNIEHMQMDSMVAQNMHEETKKSEGVKQDKVVAVIQIPNYDQISHGNNMGIKNMVHATIKEVVKECVGLSLAKKGIVAA